MDIVQSRLRPAGTRSIIRALTREYPRKMRLEPAPSFERRGIDLEFSEMDAAGVETGVIGVPAPTGKAGFESAGNQTIADLVQCFLKHFAGFGSLDTADPARALQDIRG